MRRISFVLLISVCLMLCFLGFAQAATLTLGGDHPSGDQLKIDIIDGGFLEAYLWQENPFNPGNYDFLQQYFSTFNSYLFLDYGTASQDSYTNANSDFTVMSHDLLDANTVLSSFSLGDTGIEIHQEISYETGQLYYTKEWQIKNTGETTYDSLRFIHGGDTYFAYDDSSEGHWDDMLKMVYLTNSNMGVSGIMGMYGSLSSPADHYYEGDYSSNWTYMSQGDLPDTVDGSYTDAGYSLQWNSSSLAPGEIWTIVAYEKWTEAGALQVFAPADREGLPGETLDYDFVIQNYDTSDVELSLDLSSEHDWETSFDVVLSGGSLSGSATGNATLPAGGSMVVNAQVIIPSEAAVSSTDILTLTGTSVDSPDITNSDSVTTTVIQPDVVITPPDSKNSVPGEVIAYQFIVTNNADQEDTFDLELLSENGWEINLLIPSQGNILPSATTGSVAVPGTSSVTVTGEVTVPSDLSSSMTDDLTLIATSQTDSRVSSANSVTTTVDAGHFADGDGCSIFGFTPSLFFIFLPLLLLVRK